LALKFSSLCLRTPLFVGNHPADLGPIRALPFVSRVNVYLHVFKISPMLQPVAAANLFSLASAVATQSKQRVTVDVMVQKNSMTDTVRNKIAAAAGLDPTQLQAGRNKVRQQIVVSNTTEGIVWIIVHAFRAVTPQPYALVARIS
jgi:hypothetical protein